MSEPQWKFTFLNTPLGPGPYPPFLTSTPAPLSFSSPSEGRCFGACRPHLALSKAPMLSICKWPIGSLDTRSLGALRSQPH